MASRVLGLYREIDSISRNLNQSGILSAPRFGNISVRVPGERSFLIDSDSILYDRLTPNKIARVSFDERILKGKVRDTTKDIFELHASIYKERSDVNAIIHTHSPNAAAFSIVGRAIPVTILELEWGNGGEIPVAEFARRGEHALAANALAVLGSKDKILQANHGLLALGGDLRTAFMNALVVEDAAKKNLMASSLGTPQVLPTRQQKPLNRGDHSHEFASSERS